MAMSDNNPKEETRREEQQSLEHQQQGLFRELSREQMEAERAVEAEEQSEKEKPHSGNDD